MGGPLVADVIATTWIVVPVRVEPGLQSALKLVVLAGLTALLAARGRHHWSKPSATELVLLALLTSALASAVVGGEVARSAPIAISIGCLWILVRAARHAPDVAERGVAIACAGLVIVAAVELLGADLPWTWNRRPEGTLGNRNHVAEYLVIAFPMLALWAARGSRAMRLLAAGAVVVLVATHCRTAYLAGLVACGIAVASYRAWPRRFVLGATIAIGLGALPWPGVAFTSSAGDSLSRVFTVEGSGESRIAQHRQGLAALDDVRTIVFGTGPGGWSHAAATHAHAGGAHAPRFSGAVVPNSEWLRLLVEQGLVGVGVVLALLGVALRASSRDPDRGRRAARRATLAAIAIVGTFDPLLARPELVALIAVLLARDGTAHAAHRDVRAWLVAGASTIAACVASVRCASFVASSLGAEQLAQRLWSRPGLVERRVVELANHGDCALAERQLERARSFVWGPRVALARCFARAGATREERRVWRAAVVNEPHLRALVNHHQKEKL